MDERDLKIVHAIAKHETNSSSKIHEETGIPESTIYYRLENLREEGIIENDLYDINLEKLGLNITIIAEVIATYEEEYHTIVGEKLSETEGVSQVYFSMGEMDFVVIAHVSSRREVERLIGDFEAIDEVQRTQSKFAISTIKSENRPISSYSLDRLVENLFEDAS